MVIINKGEVIKKVNQIYTLYIQSTVVPFSCIFNQYLFAAKTIKNNRNIGRKKYSIHALAYLEGFEVKPMDILSSVHCVTLLMSRCWPTTWP